MAYTIEFDREAAEDLKALAAAQRAEVRRASARFLAEEPVRASAMRRRMDPNPLGARWELRLGRLRVYYDVDEETRTVWVLRVGVKRGNRVWIRGVQVDLREQEEQGKQEAL